MKLPKEYRLLVDAAAHLYRPSGLHPHFFARGKLGHDPVFPELLRRGIFWEGARILDLGCGQAVLCAALVAARTQFERGVWPDGWPDPPKAFSLHGIDLRPQAVKWARAALGDHATFVAADLGDARLPVADIAVILDVLHYLAPDTQQRVLDAVAGTLAVPGLLLLRVGNVAAGWRSAITQASDKFSTLVRGQGWPQLYHRCVGEWKALLEIRGFGVTEEPMSEGTPFSNVLLVARRR
jgi:SAM-dependent methyltransferase